jgi:hypothetical protein
LVFEILQEILEESDNVAGLELVVLELIVVVASSLRDIEDRGGGVGPGIRGDCGVGVARPGIRGCGWECWDRGDCSGVGVAGPGTRGDCGWIAGGLRVGVLVYSPSNK